VSHDNKSKAQGGRGNQLPTGHRTRDLLGHHVQWVAMAGRVILFLGAIAGFWPLLY